MFLGLSLCSKLFLFSFETFPSVCLFGILVMDFPSAGLIYQAGYEFINHSEAHLYNKSVIFENSCCDCVLGNSLIWILTDGRQIV